ncbi:1-phosphofructokinase [Mesomycoplasma lagogenitalium]|uniref:1-phosphofructokinase family hexose kinase n=1 Tax=Mesomycoplasma lagogenitalium TaxID=171286 RepID=A0ABY8LX58_9BACT|nr:1-phosphofructokinase family hexose kinase [Mesomycoplasma lagogenitalium]WGI36903.1 1-phosphofructokinase family hexose kinase [Mesomycoplasma lagogenitalium]
MIYTLTLSPSIDLLIEDGQFELNQVNRYQNSTLLPGGKGINASIILNRHNFQTKAITFFDKNTLYTFSSFFNKENLNLINIETEKSTRINIKFYGDNTNFELNGARTIIDKKLKEKLFSELNKITSDDLLLIMGTSDENLIIEILDLLKQKQIKFVLDIDSPNLKTFLNYKPLLIKPNKDELERNFNLTIKNENDLIESLYFIQNLGSENVIISLDKNGAYLLTDKNEIYKAVIKPIKVVSATGAGDTMISIFSANYFLNQDAVSAFKLANSAAIGTVFSKWLGTEKLTNDFLSNVEIIKIK